MPKICHSSAVDMVCGVRDDGGRRVMAFCAQVCEANYDLESAKAMAVY